MLGDHFQIIIVLEAVKLPLTDILLQNVEQRNQADDSAVLVDDKEELLLGFL